jgi:methyl-accepting chemotaxis protein PixJ
MKPSDSPAFSNDDLFSWFDSPITQPTDPAPTPGNGYGNGGGNGHSTSNDSHYGSSGNTRHPNPADELDTLMGVGNGGSIAIAANPNYRPGQASNGNNMPDNGQHYTAMRQSGGKSKDNPDPDVQKFGEAMITIKTELEKAGVLHQLELRENLQQVVRLFQNAHYGVENLVAMGVQQELQTLQQRSQAIVQEIKRATTPESLYKVAVTSVQLAVQSDRALLLQATDVAQLTVLAETMAYGAPSLRGKTLPAECFGKSQVKDYATTPLLMLEDIYERQLPIYQRHLMERLQMRASLVLPLVTNDRVWGLLVILQNSDLQRWQDAEINLLQRVVAELCLQLQVIQSQAQFARTIERERTIARIVDKLRQTNDLNAQFGIITQEIRKSLNVERLAIYKFRDDFFGDFIAEAITGNYPKLVGSGWEDPYLHDHRGGRFRDNQPLIVDDIYTGETLWENGQFNLSRPKRLLTDCHIEALEFYQVKACLVVAIFQGDQLWGLLSAFQNTRVRRWEEDEVRLMLQVANQLGLVLPQAINTAQLARAIEREKAISRVTQRLRQSLDINTIFSTVTQEMRKLLNVERLTIYKFRDDFYGDFITESILGDYPKLVGSGWEDPYLHEHRGGRFRNNMPLVVDDIYKGETIWVNGQFSRTQPKRSLTDCHIQALEFYQVKACLVVAIFQGEQLWGLLSAFQNTGARQWEEDEVRLMMQMATQVGAVMQQAETAALLRKTAEREQALTRVITKVRQSLDLDNIFTTTTQEVRRLMNLERVTIYKFRPDYYGDFIAESESGGWAKLVGSGWEDPYIHDHKGGRFRDNIPLVVDDIHLGEILWESGRLRLDKPRRVLTDCHIEALEFYQVKACLVVAIFKGDQLWGLLSAFQNSKPYSWDDTDVKLMIQIASQLGAAIQQAEYFNQIQEQNRKAAREAEAERALAKVVDKIRKSTDLTTIFDTATLELRKLLSIERVAIYKFRDDYFGDILAESKLGDYPSLVGAAWEDPYLQEHQGGRFCNNETLVVDDIYQAGMTDCHVEALEYFGFKACAVVAIFKGQTLWGLLSAFQHSTPRHWEDVEVRLLTQIAGQLSFALQQSEYLEQLQTQAHEGALAIAREKDSKEAIQRNVLQLLMAVRPALDGDLTVRAPLTEDEVGTVADVYNNTLQSLRKLVVQVQMAATQVGQTSEQSGGAIAQLSHQAQQEAEEISQALRQIKAMTHSAQAVATNAQQVDAAVQQANAIVKQGDIAMNRTVDGIQGIRETVSETSKKIKRLSESSQKISKVVNLIATFTSQTQLLALNAAIEATRAGEAGKGFAVVADEVRALARQSAEATTEIEKLVQEIQIETSAVATAMDAGIEQVVGGTNLVNETRQSLNEIVAATAQISQLVGVITQAAQNQTEQSQAVAVTMTDVAAIAQQTSTEAIQISTSFQALLATAETLQTSIGQFKVQ